LRVPIVIRGPEGTGGRLSSQNSPGFDAIYSPFSGVKGVAPATPKDAKGLLKTAIRGDNPGVFFEAGRLSSVKGGAAEGELLIPIGKAEVKRKGKDVSLITWSRMYYYVEQAAAQLEQSGISAEILDLRSLRPLDEEAILATAKKTNRVVIIEEGWPHT